MRGKGGEKKRGDGLQRYHKEKGGVPGREKTESREQECPLWGGKEIVAEKRQRGGRGKPGDGWKELRLNTPRNDRSRKKNLEPKEEGT